MPSSVWQDTATAEDLAVLDPGVPENLDRTPDVLVAGGGIVGLATAAMCVRAGLGRVVVLERDRCASGPSGGAAGFLAPDNPERRLEAFTRFARSSLEATRALDAEWGFGLRSFDWLATSTEPVPETLTAEMLDGSRARAIEPALGAVESAYRVFAQATVHPLRFAAAFARRAGTVATGVEVTGWRTDGGRTIVSTSLGDLQPGALVVATGLAPDGPLPQAAVKGHLLATEPAPFELRTVITSPESLVLQLADGRIVAGGTLDAGDGEPVVREAVVERVRCELVRLVPAAAGLAVTHRWVCFRPRLDDELPVVDRLAHLDRGWFTAGHYRTGLLNAAATGRAIAEWIDSGRRPEAVAAFGADRFGREPG